MQPVIDGRSEYKIHCNDEGGSVVVFNYLIIVINNYLYNFLYNKIHFNEQINIANNERNSPPGTELIV